MIKLIIFDLDGVLVDARDLHYIALNDAIAEIAGEKYTISLNEHLSKFDGLSTTKKLNMLSDIKGLDSSLHNTIWEQKQKSTIKVINESISPNLEIISILTELKKTYKLGVASNSIRSTLKHMLKKLKIYDLFDFILSNEDVKYPKPHPEIYMRCMLNAGVSPVETLIIEDSHIGRKAAYESGAHVLGVMNNKDVTLNKINNMIDQIDKTVNKFPKWQGKNMNILIPMAGAGRRFAEAGYSFPKPLIDVKGKPMIQVAVENLNIDGNYIYIVQKEHCIKYNLDQLLNLITPGCKIIKINGITEGAACTTLLAKEYINTEDPLLIANCDQFIEWNSNEFMYSMQADKIDGGILTITAMHPKWSFVKLDDDGFVKECAEKNPISAIATVGVYYWSKGKEYVKYAEKMINKNLRVNNEFYVCPVYNEGILDNKKYKIKHIDKMWGLGTPEDLQYFLNNYEGTM